MTTMQGLDDLIAAGRVSAAEADVCRTLAAHPCVTDAVIDTNGAGAVRIEYVDAIDGERRSLRGHFAGDVARFLLAAIRRREETR